MVHTTCAVRDCTSSSRINKNLRFHQFPHTEERCKLWIDACRRLDLVGKTPESLKNMHICSLHFQKQMYGKSSLKKTAIPVLHLPNRNTYSVYTQTDPRPINIHQRDKMATTSDASFCVSVEYEDVEDDREINLTSMDVDMNRGVKIEEEITVEENSCFCRICLSVGRKMFPLEQYEALYNKLLSDKYQDQDEQTFSTVQVCWECHAVLRSVDRFQRKVRTAHDMLQSQQNIVSLSSLTTVLYNDSNPDFTYVKEKEKRTEIKPVTEPETGDELADYEILIDRETIRNARKTENSYRIKRKKMIIMPKIYTEDVLRKAVTAIHNGTSVYKASRKYNIPESTLRTKKHEIKYCRNCTTPTCDVDS